MKAEIPMNVSLQNQKKNLQEEMYFTASAIFLPGMCTQCLEPLQPSCSLEDESHLL